MQNRKRILSVKIKKAYDESPDTSYLGEYAARATSEFSIDRAHSEDCIENDSIQKDKLERIADAIENDRPICESHIDFVDETCETCSEESAYTSAIEQIRELAECEGGCGGDMERGEYRFFNPSFNYVDEHGKLAEGNTAEDVRKYVRQDYERMESLNAGSWCYIGIYATAEVQLTGDTVQTIRSGGLWGIESDSDASHIQETIREELAQLKTELTALGFSKRAIATAFKSIEEVGF